MIMGSFLYVINHFYSYNLSDAYTHCVASNNRIFYVLLCNFRRTNRGDNALNLSQRPSINAKFDQKKRQIEKYLIVLVRFCDEEKNASVKSAVSCSETKVILFQILKNVFRGWNENNIFLLCVTDLTNHLPSRLLYQHNRQVN